MPGQPYVSPLPDGRYLAVELPPESTTTDALTGELLLLPPATQLLDKLRTLLTPLPSKPTKHRLRILREALGMNQKELAERLGTTTLQIEHWESGSAILAGTQWTALENLRSQAARNGVVLSPMAQAS